MGAVLLPLNRTYSGEAIPGFASASQLSEGIEDAALCSHFEQAASATLPKEQAVSPRRASAEEYGGLMSRSQIAMWTRHKGWSAASHYMARFEAALPHQILTSGSLKNMLLEECSRSRRGEAILTSFALRM